MSLRELKQRFNLLKNSKMSKKILVLNAYGIWSINDIVLSLILLKIWFLI